MPGLVLQSLWLSLGLSFALSLVAVAQEKAYEPLLPKAYRLVWHDEFNTGELADHRWAAQFPWGTSPGDRHCQSHTRRNLAFTDSSIKLLVRKGPVDCRISSYNEAGAYSPYTAEKPYDVAVLCSRDSFRYGYYAFRVRIPPAHPYRLPSGRLESSNIGMGATIWMWRTRPKPEDYDWNEIDLIESKGIRNSWGSNVHWSPNGWNDGPDGKPTARHSWYPGLEPPEHYLQDGAFHTLAFYWTEDSISFFLDGKRTKTFRDTAICRHLLPMNIILMPMVTTNYGIMPSEWTIFPFFMELDWVRVYQRRR